MLWMALKIIIIFLFHHQLPFGSTVHLFMEEENESKKKGFPYPIQWRRLDSNGYNQIPSYSENLRKGTEA